VGSLQWPLSSISPDLGTGAPRDEMNPCSNCIIAVLSSYVN
jgi:hypothetical protein